MGRALNRWIAPLKRRIFLIVARGVIRAVNDDSGVQEIQAGYLKGELHDRNERFQEYGFTSKPFPGAEIVSLFAGGNRDHGLIIACDDRRYRLKGLQNGEVALYTDEGDKIHFKRGGIIAIEASTLLEIVAPATTISGTLAVAGNISGAQNLSITGSAAVTLDVVGAGKSLSTHTHDGGPPPD